jgi:hypothetical protein
VKLADLFQTLAPDMVEQINTASLTPFLSGNTSTNINANELLLGNALRHYKDLILINANTQLTLEQETKINQEIIQLTSLGATADSQRRAFQLIKNLISDLVGSQIEPNQDAQLREEARKESGLSLFPSMTNASIPPTGRQPDPPSQPSPRLLDVEVVAIYW